MYRGIFSNIIQMMERRVFWKMPTRGRRIFKLSIEQIAAGMHISILFHDFFTVNARFHAVFLLHALLFPCNK